MTSELKAGFLHSLRTTASVCGLVALLLALVLPLPFNRGSLSARALQDGLHIPCFALLVVLLHVIVRRFGVIGPRRALALTITLAIVAAGLTEAAQIFSDRTPDWLDLLHNLLGIAAGASILLAWRPARPGRRRLTVLVAVLVCTAALAAATRPWLEARAVARRQAAAFPMLGDFEKCWENRVWIPQGHDGRTPTSAVVTASRATRGTHSLELHTVAAAWSGVRLVFEAPVTWTPDRSLLFDLGSDDERGFTLGIRIDADGGERFTGQTEVRPGEGHYRIDPADLRNRTRSLADTRGVRVKTIVFHLGENPPPRRLHLDHVRLE